MEYIFSDKKIDYDGSQLRSHWINNNFSIYGDVIAAFIGKCDVSPKHMVDIEDLQAQSSIYSEEMLHFIVEHFDISLQETVLRQRMLVCVMKDVLEESLPGTRIVRSGDDLYEGENKLTISIATKSPVSGLIHLGINIRSDNTPVKTKGLADYNLNAKTLAENVLKKYKEELDSIKYCVTKVRWVY